MQERDMKILQFISDTRVCTTKQIQDILFPNVVPRVCYKRLQALVDSKLVKRKYYRVDEKNIYVYFLDKAINKRILKHELMITEFVVQLIKEGYEIITFEKSPNIADIIPDAEIHFKKDNRTYSLFLEVQLSNNPFIEKYYNLKDKVKREIPNTLYIVTDQFTKVEKLRYFDVVVDDLEMKKIKEIFK